MGSLDGRVSPSRAMIKIKAGGNRGKTHGVIAELVPAI
jgi:hypothetical protein